jgi:hypothetical protein
MNTLAFNNDVSRSKGSNIISFLTGNNHFNTNQYPLALYSEKGMNDYIGKVAYIILYREKILPRLSTNNSFDSIVFRDLPADEINYRDSLLIDMVSKRIEDLSDAVDFE